MEWFKVTGADKATGADKVLAVHAVDENAVRQQVAGEMLVERVERVVSSPQPYARASDPYGDWASGAGTPKSKRYMGLRWVAGATEVMAVLSYVGAGVLALSLLASPSPAADVPRVFWTFAAGLGLHFISGVAYVLRDAALWIARRS